MTEDVGYSLVFLADLAARLKVPTPVIDSLITVTWVVLARDFRAKGVRTLKTLGLDKLSPRNSPRSRTTTAALADGPAKLAPLGDQRLRFQRIIFSDCRHV